MAKRRAEDTPPAALWKDTFSDLMNLLLCFFVLLFSMSTVDSQKFEEIAASLSSSFSVLPSGGSALSKEGILVSSGASQLNDLSTYYNNMGLNTDADMSQDVQSAYDEVEKEGLEESENMAEEIENKLLQSGVADQVEVTAYSKYVMLNVSGGILFDSGKAELTTEARTLLDKVGDALVDYDDNIITIEGHTDNVPINTARYPNNMMLSLYRAYSVFDFFVSEKGFSEKSMSSSGRGDAVPIATNDTPEGRAQNRRVEIKVYNSINS
ncbi:MAG: OmpA family protein [Lachnospira sp.]